MKPQRPLHAKAPLKPISLSAACADAEKSLRDRDAVLDTLSTQAIAIAAEDAEAIAGRFRREDRPRLRRFAAKSFGHGDVAEQFPFLAYVLAMKLVVPTVREAAEAAIVAEAPLVKIARLAGVPQWTRAIPPMGCHDPRGPLPDSADFSCRIADFLRKRVEAGDDLRGLLRTVALVNGAAGEELASWLIRRHPEGTLEQELPAPMRLLVLWYLLSQLDGGLGRELIHTPWRQDLSLETGLRAVKNFSRRIELEILVGPDGLTDPWYGASQLMDLVFMPLLTSTEIRQEAIRNHNCVDWYGQRLARNEVRLFSVRGTDGRCVANIELSVPEAYPSQPRIAQIKAPRNEPATAYVAGVADIWLRRQIRAHGTPNVHRQKPPTPSAARWADIMAPLVALGRLPHWARQAPSNRDLSQTELEFTVLGCRLHTRGWRFA